MIDQLKILIINKDGYINNIYDMILYDINVRYTVDNIRYNISYSNASHTYYPRRLYLSLHTGTFIFMNTYNSILLFNIVQYAHRPSSSKDEIDGYTRSIHTSKGMIHITYRHHSYISTRQLILLSTQ